MKRTRKAVFALLGVFCAGVAFAFSSGPPDARTGAPGEGDCTGCHTSFALNSGDGSFSLTVPATYQAGDTLNITVNLSDPGQLRWGFEVTVLDASDNPVGQLLVSDATHTQKTVSGTTGRQYIKHVTAGTHAGTPDASPGWSLRWASPNVGGGNVTFYAAGNAANNNGTNQGDYIYTTSAVATELVVLCCVGIRGDANGDTSDGDVADVVYLVQYALGNGPPPVCAEEGDVNADGTSADVADIVYLVEYAFGPAGPPPAPC